MVSTMVYVHTILRDVAGLFKVGRLVAYGLFKVGRLVAYLTPTNVPLQLILLPTPKCLI